MGCLSRLANAVLMVCQLGVAGLVIGLTASKLNSIKLNFNAQNLQASVNDTCLLGSTSNGVNLCYVAYGFSGVSILATGALALLRCCTCNICGLGFLFDTVFAAAGTAWWALAGVVFKYWTSQPQIAQLPQADTRQWVVVLSWVGCALFALALLVNIISMIATCCGCCGRDKDRGNGAGRSKSGVSASSQSAPPVVHNTYIVAVPEGYDPHRYAASGAWRTGSANPAYWQQQPPYPPPPAPPLRR